MPDEKDLKNKEPNNGNDKDHKDNGNHYGRDIKPAKSHGEPICLKKKFES